MSTTQRREIKFRVWDSFLKEWVDGPCEYLQLGRIFHFNESHDHNWPEEWIAEQYTGLNDRNGREIYEGDLVRHAFPEDSDNVVLVRWTDESDECHPGFRLYDLMTQGGPMTVIGNIHENPELLVPTQ